MKSILHEDIPRWYHLFWDFESGGLFIKVSKFFLEQAPHKDMAPYFADVEKRIPFLPLFDRVESRLGQRTFGISDSISLSEEDNEWFTYKIFIPLLVSKTGLACPHCDGSGKRLSAVALNFDEPCYWCDGNKAEEVLSHEGLQKVCYSLQIFLNALAFPVYEDVPTELKQAFTITSCCEIGLHGHSVGGYASPSFIRYLEFIASDSKTSMCSDEAIKAMEVVYSKLFGKLKNYNRFTACVTTGQLVMSCPGNACEIHTEYRRNFGDGRGEDIVCHNLDSAVQQITLLSGLAAINSLFDQWLLTEA